MAPRVHLRAVIAALVLLGVPAFSALAQPAPQDTPLLIVDQEELFLRSQFGQRMREDIAAASRELAAENRQIETDLVAEERDLTERRATLPADEFRALAQAFDEKVTGIRVEQDAKARAISRANDEAQQAFFARVAAILGQIMGEKGAVAILDQRAVFLSAEAIDITELAVERIDAAIGDGTAPDSPAETDPAGPDSP